MADLFTDFEHTGALTEVEASTQRDAIVEAVRRVGEVLQVDTVASRLATGDARGLRRDLNAVNLEVGRVFTGAGVTRFTADEEQVLGSIMVTTYCRGDDITFASYALQTAARIEVFLAR